MECQSVSALILVRLSFPARHTGPDLPRRQNSLTSAWPSEEELPRSVKAYPSLAAEPTGGNLGNVK
jgi:hypothetical protein